MVKHELRTASYDLLDTSWKLKSMSWNLKLRFQIYELRVQIHEFNFTSYEFNFTSYEFKSTSCEFKSTSSRIIYSVKTQVLSLKISTFPKIQSLKSWGKSSVSGDNLEFYFSIILWLRLQKKTVWVNTNFERRDLH